MTMTIRTGLLAWPAAVILHLLHITHPQIARAAEADLASVFLMGSGCVALHTAALDAPRIARWLTPKVLMMISAAAGACAVMAASMVVFGLLNPTPSDLLISQMMLQAPAVIGLIALRTLKTVNGGDGARGRLLAGLKGFADEEIDQMTANLDTFRAFLAVQRDDPHRASGLRLAYSSDTPDDALQAFTRPFPRPRIGNDPINSARDDTAGA